MVKNFINKSFNKLKGVEDEAMDKVPNIEYTGGGIRISWGLDIKNRKVRYNDSLRYLYKELGEKELRERIQN